MPRRIKIIENGEDKAVGYGFPPLTFLYTFSTSTSAPPSSGEIRLNNATPGSSTKGYISSTDLTGADIGDFLEAYAGFGAFVTGSIVVKSISDYTKGFKADFTNFTYPTSYGSIAWPLVTALSGGLPSNGEEVIVSFVINKGYELEYGVLGCAFNGNGSAIATGTKDIDSMIVVPYDCTITASILEGGTAESGAFQLDIWKATSYLNVPPTNLDSICASAEPNISSGRYAKDTTLTGWTTSLTKGERLLCNVDDNTGGYEKMRLTLEVTK